MSLVIKVGSHVIYHWDGLIHLIKITSSGSPHDPEEEEWFYLNGLYYAIDIIEDRYVGKDNIPNEIENIRTEWGFDKARLIEGEDNIYLLVKYSPGGLLINPSTLDISVQNDF